MKIEDGIKQSYLAIQEFNAIGGNLQGDMVDKVDQQLDYIFEEFTETVDALERGNAVELIDGACDLWVTVAGLLQKLEAAGFDVAKAMQKADENNLSKYPDACGFPYDPSHSISLNETYQRWVIKDQAGKIRKPGNFEPVDLWDCVPDRFF